VRSDVSSGFTKNLKKHMIYVFISEVATKRALTTLIFRRHSVFDF